METHSLITRARSFVMRAVRLPSFEDVCMPPRPSFAAAVTIRRLGAAAALGLALIAAGGAAAAPLRLPLFGDSGRMSVPAPAGTPMADYELVYPEEARPWIAREAMDDLVGRAYPEPVTRLSAEKGARTLRVRTTPFGRSRFRNAGAEITALTAEVEDTNRCTTVWATPAQPGIGAGQIKTRPNDPCPYAQEFLNDRELVVEGLDRRGRRLFLAKSFDSRWEVRETVDDQGAMRKLFEGRSPGVPIYLQFPAPVDERLNTLRVWQVDDRGVGHKVVDIPWTPDAR
jgi:hypothetical protein